MQIIKQDLCSWQQTHNLVHQNVVTIRFNSSWHYGNALCMSISDDDTCCTAGVANTSIAIDQSIAETQLIDHA